MNLLKEHKLPLISIFILSFLIYSNTLNFDFVLDDKIVITENDYTKKGLDGVAELLKYDSMRGYFGGERNLVAGGRYRPLSLAMHALEYELAGNNPFLYHLNNVLIYALGGIILYLILIQLIPTGGVWFLGTAFLTTLLFQTNPLHTEVVANIKSRDELLSIMFSLMAFLALLHYRKKGSIALLITAGFTFLVGLLCKEGAIVLVGIIPLMVYILDKQSTVKELAPIFGTLLGAAIVYVAIRWQVIGGAKIEISRELMNNPFLDISNSDKWATIAFTMFMYIKLLLIPHPLTHDYYPKQIAITDWSDPIALFSLLIHLTLIGSFIYGVIRRNYLGLISGIYLGGIILYSNIIFPIGTFMNERFLYIPVLGLAMGTAYILDRFIKSQNLRIGLIAIIILGYAGKTYTRNFAWETDQTLSITDVEVSTNSAKCNMSAGQAFIDRADNQKSQAAKQKDLAKAIKHLNKSLEIYPGYSPPMLLLGNAYTSLKDFDRGVAYYEACLKNNVQTQFALQNLIAVGSQATAAEKYKAAEKAYLTYLNYKGDAKVMETLGELYGKNMQQLDKSILYLEKAYTFLPNDVNIIQKLGVAHAISGHTDRAINLFESGVKLDEKNGHMWLNLYFAYQSVGRNEEASRCLQKVQELNPELLQENS